MASTLPASASEGLRSLARQEGATLFMAFLAALQALLGRCSGQERFNVGTPIAGRNRLETERLIGFFINTLVLRADLSGDPGFRALLGRVREITLDAYVHQDLPFEKLVEELDPERSLTHSPLFQVLLTFQAGRSWSLDLAGLTLRPVELPIATAKFDLTLSVAEIGTDIALGLEYRTDLFDGTTVERLLQAFQDLLSAWAAAPEERVSDLPLLSEARRAQVLTEWNDTAARPWSGLIHERFAEQAARLPAAVAAVFEGEALSYRELNGWANRIAHHLRGRGVGPGVVVGLYVERSLAALAAMLGILKAGGAYAPLEPTHPRERLAWMLATAGTPVLVTQAELVERVPPFGGELVLLDRIVAEREDDPVAAAGAGDLAYVLFTSGSTGRPKGVAVEHRQILSYLQGILERMELPEGASYATVTSFAADLGNTAIFPALSTGGCLHVVSLERAADPEALADYASRHPIDCLKIVPSHLAALSVSPRFGEILPRRLLVLGGEAAGPELLDRLDAAAPRLRVLNHYGPTETTVGVLTHPGRGRRAASGALPLGRPLANSRVHVVDPGLRPVPFGAPGELVIAGAGVSRGYLGEPALTAERFVPDPFAGPEEAGARLYRTGDRARHLADGAVEFLGRVDLQVKVRGFRVEPGEVELALAAHPSVQAAAVVARALGGDRRLVAYVVPRPGARLEPQVLAAFLRERLPEAFVPSVFVELDALPLTPNGKVDRRSLPAPDRLRPNLGETFVAPRTPVEELLAAIWSQVLGVDRVGARDNFFTLGGHSLLATQVVSRLRPAFGVEIPLRKIFEAPTVAGLAREIEAARMAGQALEAPPIVPVQRDGELPLSFSQERLWFLEQLEPGTPVYNVPVALRLRGPLSLAILERVIRGIAGRHEVLRTTFESVDGRPRQVIAPRFDAPIPIADLSGLPEALRETTARRLTRAEAERPFDLARGPLLRAAFLRLSPSENWLQLTAHHIVTDGWSRGIFVRELAALYVALSGDGAPPLPELPVQYADFAVWQRRWLQGELLEAHLAYWRERLGRELEPLRLPMDRPRPAVPSHRGGVWQVEASPRLSQALRRLSLEAGATPFMTLLAGWMALLHRYSGQTGLAVGSPIANRNREEIEGLIGFFVNILVLRSEVTGDLPFTDLLERVRETTLGAYAHQDLPFEKLMAEISPERDLSMSPLFQTMLVLQNAPLEELRFPGLEVQLEQPGSGAARFDLTLSFGGSTDILRGAIEYNADLFDETTVERLVRHLLRLLGSGAADPRRAVSDLPLLDELECQQLVVEWNDTRVSVSGVPGAHRLFEGQVERRPQAVAVRFAGRAVSYAELDARANRLAHVLRRLGAGPERPVGLCVERSVEMVVGLLGILKSGGFYLPLDPSYPKERLAWMLEDSGAPLVVTQQVLLDVLPGIHSGVVLLEPGAGFLAGEPEESPAVEVHPGNVVYALFTSGSTGRPKGVQIPHGALINLLSTIAERPGFGEEDVLLSVSSLSFDIATLEILLPLSTGGQVVVAGREVVTDGVLLAAEIESSGATVLQATPATWRMLEESGWRGAAGLKAMTGGETLARGLAQKLTERAASLWNLYGPTETTIYSTRHQVAESRGPVPIGRALGNTTLHVVDGWFAPVPLGVVGELLIGGAGVARGYLGRPDLTAERFVPDPFAGSATAGARVYRTGDLARRLPDGVLEFLGRSDHQVKIRGFRIELEEVEAALEAQSSVGLAAAAVRNVAGDPRLVAYVVPAAGEQPDAAELRRSLAQRLPEFMIPLHFMILPALPLTPGGKVDRRALPAPVSEGGQALGSVAPRDLLELQLAQLWEEVLGHRPIGVFDNFFEIGGHSLLAVQLMARLERLSGRRLPVASLFQAPTVERMAVLLRGEEMPAARSSLVLLQPQGARPPLFFVHGAAGTVFPFFDLARELGPDRPFYALQAPGVEEGAEPSSTVQDLAAHYLEEIRAVQPEGPFHLGGWSLGGVVAFEMAQQLQAGGQQVGLLALVDSRVPRKPAKSPRDPEIGLLDSFARNLGLPVPDPAKAARELRRLGSDERLRRLLEEACRAGIVPPDLELDSLRRLFAVFRSGLGALATYEARPYPGPVLLIRSEVTNGRNATLGWGRIAGAGVEVHQVAGDHFTMLRRPHVTAIAGLIRAGLTGQEAIAGGVRVSSSEPPRELVSYVEK
jgi:amino acid adenylation domain-containing protein